MSHYSLRDDVALILLDHPPVNSLVYPLRCRLLEALDKANDDPSVRAIVLAGSESVFSGGADIQEFVVGDANRAPNLPDLIEALDRSSKPIVAAVGRLCMGGGLELALGCHARVFASGAKVSFPEIHLGLIPGAGGTQRMPRAVGLEKAASMILTGTPIAVEGLTGTPLVAAIAETDLEGTAVTYAKGLIPAAAPPSRLRDLAVVDSEGELYLSWLRNMVRPRLAGQPALGAALDALRAALTTPFEVGDRTERQHFWSLVNSPEARALSHAFLAERQCGKVPGLSGVDSVRQIERVGVIGAGTMGTGIALNFLKAGIPVILLDTKPEALERGRATIEAVTDGQVRKGKLTATERFDRLALLTTSLSYEALAETDLVVEAVFEDMAVKTEVFREIERAVRPEAILASNTSTLDLDQLAGGCRHPERVIGLHFFSPAHIMKLLEVVRCAKTSDAVLSAAMSVARRIGKVAVVSGVCDGFIGNRMLNQYLRIAGLLVDQGASPWQIDRALEKWGMAMGPFRMMDMAGNDIGWSIRKRLYREKPELRFSLLADQLCEMGRFGQKSGRGWYRYPPGERNGLPDPIVDGLIADYRTQAGVTPRGFNDAEIVDACVLALVQEGSRILEEGIALRAGDIDVVYLNGYGFPRHRGGPMHYADMQGLHRVHRRLEELAHASDADAAFWTPSPLIKSLAASGKSFT